MGDAVAAARAMAVALWGGEWQALPPVTVSGAASTGEDGGARAVLVKEHTGPAALHLPAWALRADPACAAAIAAHAAAHQRFGAPPQARQGLKPVQQALLGALEDARVEWLAMQELPGLRRLWWPFHARALLRAQGPGFDDLLTRLGAALLDPSHAGLHAEPHAWVAKVRGAFFAPDGQGLALQTPAQLRAAASLLGNDIGQMRLPFDPRAHRVGAAYRDDHSHLWLPDDAPPSDTPLAADEAPLRDAPPPPPATAAPADPLPTARHPEWDHRIARLRPQWCSVFETDLPAGPPGWSLGDLAAGRHRMARWLGARLGHPRPGSTRRADGDEPHAVALVDAAIERRARCTPDPRVFRAPRQATSPRSVLLLLDASASTAGPMLGRLQQGALETAMALRLLGHRSAVWAFASHGRHRIDMPCLWHWDEPVPAAGLVPLRAAGSTRAGAALRHAVHLLAQERQALPARRPVVVLLTDGELHDVDVHDPNYLPADLNRAAAEARARRVAVCSLVHAPGNPRPLQRALGLRHVSACTGPGAWPVAVCALLAHADR
ncbi:hypothetical protein ACLIJR_12960 [Hydrogenophaga sp. XSHU_21]